MHALHKYACRPKLQFIPSSRSLIISRSLAPLLSRCPPHLLICLLSREDKRELLHTPKMILALER